MSRAGPFLAIARKSPRESNLLCLTPRVMRWSDSVWIFDLGSCLDYWEERARRTGSDWKHAVTEIVLSSFFEEKRGRFQASLASHPWKAALLLTAIVSKKLQGLVDLQDPEGLDLYRGLSWRLWFRGAAAMGSHLQKAKEPRFRRADLLRDLTRMKRAMSRLSLSKPLELQDASPASIQRRFGPHLARLWSWTLDRGDGQSCDDFPWVGWSPREKPSVRRDLEFPLGEWEPLAELLVEDLDRLCDQECWGSEERVIRLHWDLEFDRASALCIPIVFRYPHDLRAERGAHKTTLIQARYGIGEAGEKILAERRADEFQLVSLLSWKLTVAERLIPPARFPDLFGEKDHEEEERKLVRLENQLRVTLENYAFRRDWLYSDSFARLPEGQLASSLLSDASSWLRLAKQRPIFVYTKPFAMEPEEQRGARLFLERTGLKWWRVEGAAQSQRDFYALLDARERLQWVAEEGGMLHAHGIFA